MPLSSKNLIAIIPARKGSKGLPNKNIRCLGGKPLICWTIESALKANCFSKIVISTDDHRILELNDKYADDRFVFKKRSPHLCKDNVPGLEVVKDVIKDFSHLEYGMVLQPTSPLRDAQDIQNVIQQGLESKSHSIVSMSAVTKHPNWYYFVLKKNLKLRKYLKETLDPLRQNFDELYAPNGAIYFFSFEFITQRNELITETSEAFLMKAEKSIDIDNQFDFELCEYLISKKRPK